MAPASRAQPRRRLRTLALGLALPALAATSACWVNPATGKAELSLINEADEAALGQRYDKEIVEHFGLIEDEALQTYVNDIGQRIAATSNRPALGWTFRVLDDPEVNAFALPGGYVYVTRGLLVHLEREDALAAVLAHEVGHVAARHSVNQVSRAAVAGSGVGLISIISPRAGKRASARLELGFLAHSREDEMEADDLGVRYARAAGFDGRAMLEVLAMLGDYEKLAGGDAIPTHMRTHPDPSLRLGRLEPALGKLDPPPADHPARGEFLARTDGLLYGSDFRQGVVLGERWIYPAGGLEITLPPNWDSESGAGVVIATADTEDALLLARAGDYESAEAGEQELLSGGGIELGPEWEVQLGGWPTRARYFGFKEDPPRFRGLYAFVETHSGVWELVALTTVEKLEDMAAAFEGSMLSFRALTEPKLRGLQPRRVEVRTLSGPASLEALVASSPVAVDIPNLALINGVDPSATLPAGSTVRWVVGFDPEPYRHGSPAPETSPARG